MMLLYLVAAGLFAVSALVVTLAHRRLERVRAYASEAAARSAAYSGLERARAALLSGDLDYEGGLAEWPRGQSAEIRVWKRGSERPTFEVTVRGSCARGSGRPAVRTLRAIFDFDQGRPFLASVYLIPRAELAQLR